MKRLISLALVALAAAGPLHAQSLYNEATFTPLVADHRARQPGDVLTVLVYETSSATTSADTAMQRRNEFSVGASWDRHNHRAALGTSNVFDGGGTVRRSGRLLAQLTVTVTGIAENGDLLVAGEQNVEINSDMQHFSLEGRVRPIDITNNNTVLSNRIADARINYLGDGELAERQRPGFWSKVMTWLGF